MDPNTMNSSLPFRPHSCPLPELKRSYDTKTRWIQKHVAKETQENNECHFQCKGLEACFDPLNCAQLVQNPNAIFDVFEQYVQSVLRRGHPLRLHKNRNYLRVMSYNVEGGFLDPQECNQFWKILYLIATSESDIVCLQNISFNHVNRLNFELFIHHMATIGFAFHVASSPFSSSSLSYKQKYHATFSRWPFLESTCMPLFSSFSSLSSFLKSSNSKGTKCRMKNSQSVLVARVENVWIVNTELCDGQDLQANETRIVQLRALLAFLKQYAPPYASHVILCGTLNALKREDYHEEHLAWIRKYDAAQTESKAQRPKKQKEKGTKGKKETTETKETGEAVEKRRAEFWTHLNDANLYDAASLIKPQPTMMQTDNATYPLNVTYKEGRRADYFFVSGQTQVKHLLTIPLTYVAHLPQIIDLTF